MMSLRISQIHLIQFFEEQPIMQPVKEEQMRQQINQQQEQIETLQKRVRELESKTEQNLFDEMLLNASKSKEDQFKKMKIAIELNANVEVQDEKGQTAIFFTLLNNKMQCDELLVRSNANLNTVNKQGESLLEAICQRTEKIEPVKFLLNRMSKEDKEAQVLKLAYDVSSTREIKQLIADTMLFQAAKQNNLDLLREAIDVYGANKNAQDNSHRETALHKACYNGQKEMVQFLLDKNCSITLKNCNQETPFQTTSKTEIKSLIQQYQAGKAAIIQSHIKGFLWRKSPTLEEMKKSRKKEILNEIARLASDDATLEDVGKILSLGKALKEDRLHDAKQQIRGKPQEDLDISQISKTGLVRY